MQPVGIIITWFYTTKAFKSHLNSHLQPRCHSKTRSLSKQLLPKELRKIGRLWSLFFKIRGTVNHFKFCLLNVLLGGVLFLLVSCLLKCRNSKEKTLFCYLADAITLRGYPYFEILRSTKEIGKYLDVLTLYVTRTCVKKQNLYMKTTQKIWQNKKNWTRNGAINNTFQ